MTTPIVTTPLPWHQSHWNKITAQVAAQTMPHAYLVSADADTGKRHFATMLAQFLLCRNPIDNAACGICSMCLLNEAGSNPDLMIVEPEEGSKIIKVDQVRELKKFLETSSHSFGKRVILLDTAESLGVNSANALLKGLEEPPADVLFLLLTDRPKTVLATVTSRCQVIALPHPQPADVLAWLTEHVPDAKPEELSLLLDISQNRPFKALAMHVEGRTEQHSEIGSALMELVSRKSSPTVIASRYAKAQATEVLQVLSYWLSALSRYQLTGRIEFLKGSFLKQAGSILLTKEDHSRQQTRALFSLYTEVMAAQSQLLGGSNPNAQLLLEDLFIQLQNLTRYRSA